MSDAQRRADRRRLRWQQVLILTPNRKSQSTIQRCYDVWRQEMGIPRRCDNPRCVFYVTPLIWNGVKLKPILDHGDGNKFNNHPSNLRYLCPNCDSQLGTRGGANRGRVEFTSDDGYVLKNRDGTKIAAATGRAHGSASAVAVGDLKTNEEA